MFGFVYIIHEHKFGVKHLI